HGLVAPPLQRLRARRRALRRQLVSRGASGARRDRRAERHRAARLAWRPAGLRLGGHVDVLELPEEQEHGLAQCLLLRRIVRMAGVVEVLVRVPDRELVLTDARARGSKHLAELRLSPYGAEHA